MQILHDEDGVKFNFHSVIKCILDVCVVMCVYVRMSVGRNSLNFFQILRSFQFVILHFIYSSKDV